MSFENIRGLYLLTPDSGNSDQLLMKLESALKGRPSLVQYRNKTASPPQQRYEASAAASLCRTAGIPFIVNDSVELSLEVDADGVHLGKADGDLRQAKERLGEGKILGASCYDDVNTAFAALAGGATYIAFGSVFPSVTKPRASSAPLALLADFRSRMNEVTRLPIVAIGGITIENAAQIIDAGADLLAVISDVFNAIDPEARVAAYQSLFRKKR